MSNFVKLHQVDADGDLAVTDVWVNLDRVDALWPSSLATTMIAIGDDRFYVTESAESICRLAAGERS